MKNKIFAKLKQVYPSLGLGDELLMAHAEGLANLGYVTDENIDTVVAGQKTFLETLQRGNDQRVEKALEKARKAAEEEAKKREEAAKKAAEEAEKQRLADEAKKAAEAAEAKRLADEAAAAEAARKAAEEAEKKRLEDIKRNTEIPEWFKTMQEEAAKAREKERADAQRQRSELEAQLKAITDASTSKQSEFSKLIEELTKRNEQLETGYNTIKAERDAQAAAQAKADRESKILNIAKELEIPQYRIDEGFTIADDADETAIRSQLAVISNNIKTNALPSNQQKFVMGDNNPSATELADLAKSIVK
jgi:hypothetical protein